MKNKLISKSKLLQIGFSEKALNEYSIIGVGGHEYLLNMLDEVIEVSINREWIAPIIFVGKIKSKPDMKRLLKQLGIND